MLQTDGQVGLGLQGRKQALCSRGIHAYDHAEKGAAYAPLLLYSLLHDTRPSERVSDGLVYSVFKIF